MLLDGFVTVELERDLIHLVQTMFCCFRMVVKFFLLAPTLTVVAVTAAVTVVVAVAVATIAVAAVAVAVAAVVAAAVGIPKTVAIVFAA